MNDPEFGSQNPEDEAYTVKDVVEFLEKMAVIDESATEEHALYGEITLHGTTGYEEINIIKQAIESLKQNDAHLACAFLEREITLCKELVKNPTKNYRAGFAPRDPAKIEELKTKYQKKLEQFIKLRSAID